jgi:hypothetical protein
MEIIERVVSSAEDKIVIVEDFYEFCPEIWDKIKDFAGIKKDCPVIELSHILRQSNSVDYFKYILRNTFRIGELNPELSIMCSEYREDYIKINGKWSRKMKKMELKKILLRTFWTKSHPDLYNLVVKSFREGYKPVDLGNHVRQTLFQNGEWAMSDLISEICVGYDSSSKMLKKIGF